MMVTILRRSAHNGRDYGDEDTSSAYGGDIEAQLAQMRRDTFEALRKTYTVAGDDAQVQDETGSPTLAPTPLQKRLQPDAAASIASNGAMELGIIASALRKNKDSTSAVQVPDSASANSDTTVARRIVDFAASSGGPTVQNAALAGGHIHMAGLISNALGLSNERLGRIMAFAQFPDQVSALDAYTNGVRYELTGDDYMPAKHGLNSMQALHALNGKTVSKNFGTFQSIISAHRDDDAVVGIALHAMVDAVFHSHPVVGKDGVTRQVTYDAPEGHGAQGANPDYIGADQIKMAGGAVIEALQTVTGQNLTPNQRTGAMNFVLQALAEAKGMTLQQGHESSYDSLERTEQNFRSVASRILGSSPNVQLLQPNDIQKPMTAQPNTRDLVNDQTLQFLNSGNSKFSREFAADFATRGMDAATQVMDEYRWKTTGEKSSTSPNDLMDTKDWSVLRLFRPTPNGDNWPSKPDQPSIDPVPGWSMKNVVPGYRPQLPPSLRAFGL